MRAQPDQKGASKPSKKFPYSQLEISSPSRLIILFCYAACMCVCLEIKSLLLLPHRVHPSTSKQTDRSDTNATH